MSGFTVYHKNMRLRAFAMLCALIWLALALPALGEAVPEASEAPAAYLDGDSASVRAAQQRLIDLGLLKGGADGAYGPKTEAALREFQTQRSLEASGHLDADTYNALTHVDPANATAKDVQQRLIDLGYLEGVADGVIGPKSTDALKLFQRLSGLSANGKANSETLEALFDADAIALPATLSPGAKGDDVTRLQKRLIQFGFLEGAPDSSYGQTTSAAVKAFQEHLIAQGYSEGITADGKATPLTLYCLYSDRYSTYLHDVKKDVSDSEALRIERRLNQLGYMDPPIDDVLDDYALVALELFKTEAGFETADDADKETIDALFDESAPQAEYCVPHDIASGDSGQVVRDVENALICGGMLTRMPSGQYNGGLEEAIERLHAYLVSEDDPNAPMFADARALSADAVESLVDGLLSYRFDSADSASEIKRMQSRLYTLYYLDREGVDGYMGHDSRSALREFQEANGLEKTGKADGDTLDLLFSAQALAKPFPYRIEVSIDAQTVSVYERDGEGDYDHVQTFTCSTGLHNSTPRGIFLHGRPANRWHFFQKFNCWAQYSYVIVDDIMFHSVIYSSNNERSLRSGSLYALGNPASHGCIRLKVEDAKWLFEHCKKGTAVIVIY